MDQIKSERKKNIEYKQTTYTLTQRIGLRTNWNVRKTKKNYEFL